MKLKFGLIWNLFGCDWLCTNKNEKPGPGSLQQQKSHIIPIDAEGVYRYLPTLFIK